MKVKLEEASINEMAEINMIQKLAFKASYDKYGYCPVFEMTDEQIVAYFSGDKLKIKNFVRLI